MHAYEAAIDAVSMQHCALMLLAGTCAHMRHQAACRAGSQLACQHILCWQTKLCAAAGLPCGGFAQCE